MNCETYQPDLKAYCDNELPLFRRLAIGRHLGACASCRNEVKNMEQISKNLQATESVEPLSQDLRTRILAEAAKQGRPEKGSPAPPSLGAKMRFSPTLVGAICTVFAVAALFVMHPWGLAQRNFVMTDQSINAAAPAAQPQARELLSPSNSSAVAHLDNKDKQALDKAMLAGHGNSYGGADVNVGQQAAKWSNDKPSSTFSDSQSRVDASGKTAFSSSSAAPKSASGSDGAVGTDTDVQGAAPTNSPSNNLNGQQQMYFAAPQPSTDSSKTFAPAGRAASPGTAVNSAGAKAPAASNEVAAAPSAANGNASALAIDDISLDRQVHREASVTVQMKDPEAASDQVNQMVRDAGGYVASNNLTTDDSGMKSAQMVLKVPVAQFETVLGQIEKLGNVTAKNVTGDDITNKTSDATQAEAVLDDEANRAAARLRSLGKHAKWSDVEDARELRIQLAQARARVQLLHKLAALSDITVSLTQTPKPAPPAQAGFLNNLKGNGSKAFQSLVSSVEALLTMLIWALAYAPIWGPLAFAVWYAVRRRRETAQPT